MKVMILGLCCVMLLAISAIAGERPQDSWFSVIDHGGVSLNKLKAAREEKFYLIDINHDKVISPDEVANSPIWSNRFIRLDTNANGFVNLADFETMALTVFSFFDINSDGQITTHETLKFQQKTMRPASAKKIS